MSKGKKKLRVIPLGGLQEIGKNVTVFEYDDDMIVVDCGISFPEEDMLGIDLVIPDVTYLIKNKERIRGIFLTHGHEDHIGALPYVLRDLKVAVYGTRLTMGLLSKKLEEYGLKGKTAMRVVSQGQTIEAGAFKVEFIRSTHSIADSTSFAIHTPIGVVVHTSDFKIDHTPIGGEGMDLARFAVLGNSGVLLLMSESTNVEREGYTMSEKTVGVTFQRLFQKAKGRILVATFASNIHRMQQAINGAVELGRKVAVCGRSMENVIDVAMDLGYLGIPEGTLIDI
ncbi:MAG: ribonuclease J, partial [Oscillospiraceae bacterium]|nr:ribonuclease J [Oscillospiraceae bacterium]